MEEIDLNKLNIDQLEIYVKKWRKRIDKSRDALDKIVDKD